MVSFFDHFILRKVKLSFCTYKVPGEKRRFINKKKLTRKSESHRVIHENFRNCVSNFLIDMPLRVARLFAKAIADNDWTTELLSKWIFYKIPSNEFSKLWDPMRKNLFLSIVEFFFYYKQRACCLV